MIQLYALSPQPLAADAALLAWCESLLDAADWHGATRVAPIDDDLQAESVLFLMRRGARTERDGDRLVVTFSCGRITFRALRGEASAMDARMVDGVIITLEDFDELHEIIAVHVAKEAAIGLVFHRDGIVIDGDTMWQAGTWVARRRIYALSPQPLARDEELLAACRHEIAVADWWTCAEFAGIEDDDEAAALIDRMCDGETATIEGDTLTISFASGRMRFRALREQASELREGVVDGVVISLDTFEGIEADIAARAARGAAIGLVMAHGGVVVDGTSVWDTAADKWLA